MNPNAELDNLVTKLVVGVDVRSALSRLRKSGQAGVNRILDAMDGKFGPAPKTRHPRDVADDLIGGLHAVASVDANALIVALKRRPKHAFALIWALGGSREKTAVQTLIAYSTHHDKWVRWAAVEGLARRRQKSLMEPLLVALRDRADLVRFSALVGLQKIADYRAIEGLKHYLSRKRLSPGGKRLASALLARLEKAK
jgi:HEAT repeat protein